MAQQLTFKEIWDVRYAIILGVIAAIFVVIAMIATLMSMFTPDGLVVSAQFDAGTALGTLSIGTSQTAATVTEAQFVVPDATWMSGVGLVTSVVARSLSYLIVIACALVVCRNLTNGRAFSLLNTRCIHVAGASLIAGALLGFLGLSLGLNDAFRSIGFDADTIGTNAPVAYWPTLFAGFALTILAIAFRAGERLQRDTEGLV